MTGDDAKPKKKKAPRYQKRLVLFLDFLGFKEHVERSAREPIHLARLVAAMDVVGEIGASHKGVLKSQKVTQFSDSIVVSYKVSEPSAVFLLLNDIALGIVDLAQRGFLVRGGVTVGELYHSKRHVVGPAMNEAHRLESKVAKYPRVLIDPKVLDVARAARRSEHSPDDEAGYVSDFMTRDADGRYFFDYISWSSVVAITGGENELYGDYLGCLSTLVRDGLRHDDPGVQEKFLWLRRRYKAAIAQIKAIPADHPYRDDNAAMCEVIAGLPVFKIDTKLAKAAVKAAARAKDKTKPASKPRRRRARAD